MSSTTMSTGPILQVEHLSMKFGGLVAIGDLSFDVGRGEITALIGPNGAGKTTVFNCITGFYKPTEGMIRFTGREGGEFLLERMPDFQITAKAKVARTFQNIRLFSGMTVLENLLVAQHNKLMKASGYTILGLLGIGNYREASAESVEKAKYWLDKAELIDRADDPAGDLPYGAQRRLEIARAMCTDPELLCLDEPAAGLNPKESLALNTLLKDIKTNTGTSILLIEHDMSVVMEISDHIVVLEYGRKISDGDPTSVRTDPRVIAAYLGVDDEEVEEVLIQVGDGDVIEELDTGSEAHLLARPVNDSVVQAKQPSVQAGKRAAKKAPAKQRSEAKVKAAPKSTELRASGPKKVVAAAKATSTQKAETSKAATSKPVATGPKKPTSSTAAKAISNRLAAPRAGRADDLLEINGVGPVNLRKLNEHGIFHFDQIAAWKKADVQAAEAYLAFDGRIAREDWVGQAKALSKKAASAAATKRGVRK